MNKQTKPAKKDIFTDLWNHGVHTHVDFDPRVPGVGLPAFLQDGRYSLRLDYQNSPSHPTEGLVISDDGLMCVQLFRNVRYQTFVPWSAIYCISFETDGTSRGVMYNDNMPPEMQKRVIEASEALVAQKLAAPPADPTPGEPAPNNVIDFASRAQKIRLERATKRS